ncbi:MAG: hypothetical protein DMF82_14525 [Acidobacteria bacterium]|nr:MAG: hypothetical protein DMF82_14525 [Acidobacteriota bacterium]
MGLVGDERVAAGASGQRDLLLGAGFQVDDHQAGGAFRLEHGGQQQVAEHDARLHGAVGAGDPEVLHHRPQPRRRGGGGHARAERGHDEAARQEPGHPGGL